MCRLLQYPAPYSSRVLFNQDSGVAHMFTGQYQLRDLNLTDMFDV
jgi:hypothetical protein